MRAIVTLNDGAELEAPHEAPTLADSLAWERQFKASYVAVERAAQEARESAGDDDHEARPIDPALAMRTEWMLFFIFRRLRERHPGALPAKFDQFLERVESLRFETDPEDDDDDAASVEGAQEMDPTVREDATVPAP